MRPSSEARGCPPAAGPGLPGPETIIRGPPSGGLLGVDLLKFENEGEGMAHGPKTTATPATSASSSPSLAPCPHPAVPSLVRLVDDSESTANGHREDNAGEPEPEEEAWTVPASSKSRRTHNPIRAVVDPIVASSVKSGRERGDGKDQISLAVSQEGVKWNETHYDLRSELMH